MCFWQFTKIDFFGGWIFQNHHSRDFSEPEYDQKVSLAICTLNEQKMIFLLEAIYIWKELVWNIKFFDQRQTRNNQSLRIRFEEPLFLTSRSTVRAQNKTISCNKSKTLSKRNYRFRLLCNNVNLGALNSKIWLLNNITVCFFNSMRLFHLIFSLSLQN